MVVRLILNHLSHKADVVACMVMSMALVASRTVLVAKAVNFCNMVRDGWGVKLKPQNLCVNLIDCRDCSLGTCENITLKWSAIKKKKEKKRKKNCSHSKCHE